MNNIKINPPSKVIGKPKAKIFNCGEALVKTPNATLKTNSVITPGIHQDKPKLNIMLPKLAK